MRKHTAFFFLCYFDRMQNCINLIIWRELQPMHCTKFPLRSPGNYLLPFLIPSGLCSFSSKEADICSQILTMDETCSTTRAYRTTTKPLSDASSMICMIAIQEDLRPANLFSYCESLQANCTMLEECTVLSTVILKNVLRF